MCHWWSYSSMSQQQVCTCITLMFEFCWDPFKISRPSSVIPQLWLRVKSVKVIVSLRRLLQQIFLCALRVRDSCRLLLSHSNGKTIMFTFTGYGTILFDSIDEKWSGQRGVGWRPCTTSSYRDFRTSYWGLCLFNRFHEIAAQNPLCNLSCLNYFKDSSQASTRRMIQ
jgi:hypothetical protein